MGLPVEVNNLMLGSLGGYTVGRSLRFRPSASAYLNRTPASAGNRRTFTWSGWLKYCVSSNYSVIFSALNGSTDQDALYLDQTNPTLIVRWDANAGIALQTAQVFRDPSAWYHIILAVDTTQATASNRMKLYVNGVQITAFTTANYPTLNQQANGWNTTNPHYHGVQAQSLVATNTLLNGYLAEVNFIDGQALTPSSFGAYDTNGVWQPKKYSGTYGTNGFYLPFSLNSNSTYAGSFNGSSQYLSIGNNAAFNLGSNSFTVEAWINPSALPTSGNIANIAAQYDGGGATTNRSFLFALYNNSGTQQLLFQPVSGSTETSIAFNYAFSTGQWYHVAAVRNSNTITLYVNGASIGSTSYSSTINNSTTNFTIGARLNSGAYQLGFNGSISNFRLVNGSAVYTSNFAPSSSALTAITNTQLLTLQSATIIDNSANAFTITNNGTVTTSAATPFVANIFGDLSGNNNNWTGNNINYTTSGTTYDSMIDSPTNAAGASTGIGNYAVLNPLDKNASSTLSNANLTSASGTTSWYGVKSSFAVTSGKWYWEVTSVSHAANTAIMIGVADASATLTFPGATANGYGYWSNAAGQMLKYNNNVGATYGTSFVQGDVIGVAFDADAGTITFYVNGVSQGQAFSGITSGPYFPMVGNYSTTTAINFGQRPFAYTPPSGFKALNTYNLPAPSIANGAQYMAATTYTGNGSTQSISNAVNGVSFQPDFVWLKVRNQARSHRLLDSVRGATKEIYSDLTIAEATDVNGLTAFNSNGFSVGSSNTGNANTDTYVGWQWKAGGTGVTNTSGTITSTVSANTTAGFSVVTYTGNGNVSATVGHGLGVAPSMIIVKGRNDGTYRWRVYHSSLTAGNMLLLDQTSAQQAINTDGGVSSVGSSTFGFSGGVPAVNTNGNTYVAYCFSAVRGYSAFGSYNGTGSSDGAFVYTGFRPRWIMIKRTDTLGYWAIKDSSRNGYNQTDPLLYANIADAEYSAAQAIDILSNGFKLRSTGADTNASGGTYVYAAFAEHPFQASRAR